MTVSTISVRAPQSYYDGKAAAQEKARREKEMRREAWMQMREERARQRRREAFHNIMYIIYANIMRVWYSLPSLPERLYRGTLDVMARVIILCLFIGAMLFAFGFFALAFMWLFNTAMPPYWA